MSPIFNEHWPDLPRSLQACLRANTRESLTTPTRERNKAYMKGIAAAYRELGKLDLETYSFALGLIDADHMAETIQGAPF